ncbi:MAG: RnfABCDGE type electron transport complex subunit D [Methylobacteriaceae bacterium]|nr:RnfABCDGE type electron transport complex subunit D [Methylobacteriaceae bacterium]
MDAVPGSATKHSLGVGPGRLVEALRQECRDARMWQIAALSGLLAWNIAELSLGASLVPSLVSVGGALFAQIVASRLAGLPRIDLRSALITGLSLSLLLRGDALWVQALAAALAIGSKFVIRVRGKHVFNPATFAIFVLLFTGHAWVTPGQWGQSAFIVSAIAFLGILVLTRATRLDLALSFLVAYVGLLFLRAAWLGDPVAIPLHQAQNGALLLFACFMITDPRSTPDARIARILFALAVAVTAHWLLFFQQMPSALYASLMAASLAVPILDRLFPASRFVWRRPMEVSR